MVKNYKEYKVKYKVSGTVKFMEKNLRNCLIEIRRNEEKSAVFVVEQRGTFFMLGWKHKKK